MALPYDRVYNFSAGPGTLPLDVLQQVQAELLNYRGTGVSVIEMSHRSPAFEKIIHEAEEDLRVLLNIPETHRVLFLQGGANLQFSMIPIAFLYKHQIAEYVVTGTWGEKAMQAAAIEGTAHAVYNGKPENYKRAPAISELDLNAMAQYVHFTSNETIQGIQYQTDPKVVNHLICDMSSDILSRPVEIANYDLIYAGAQKNMGPAGMTLVIISERLIHRTPDGMHPMLDYRLLSEKKSLYNTPCTFSIYVSGLVYKKLLREGGLTTVQSKNAAKAEALYHEIDSSEGFYTGHALSDSRSQMNVTFTLPSEPLTTKFLMEAALAGMVELKGHRSVGGCRASIYNAFPLEGCLALATFMGKFAQDNR